MRGRRWKQCYTVVAMRVGQPPTEHHVHSCALDELVRRENRWE
jgi:hypothetical protein